MDSILHGIPSWAFTAFVYMSSKLSPAKLLETFCGIRRAGLTVLRVSGGGSSEHFYA